jgi:hypothetical protein
VKEGPKAESYPMIESADFRGSFTGPADVPAVGRKNDESLMPGGVSDDSVGTVPGMTSDSSFLRPTAGTSAGPVKEPRKSADSIIGYDSAFGPSFTVDSTGRIVPIVKKKP